MSLFTSRIFPSSLPPRNTNLYRMSNSRFYPEAPDSESAEGMVPLLRKFCCQRRDQVLDAESLATFILNQNGKPQASRKAIVQKCEQQLQFQIRRLVNLYKQKHGYIVFDQDKLFQAQNQILLPNPASIKGLLGKYCAGNRLRLRYQAKAQTASGKRVASNSQFVMRMQCDFERRTSKRKEESEREFQRIKSQSRMLIRVKTLDYQRIRELASFKQY